MNKKIKERYKVYDGMYVSMFKHIPEISFYNNNYYIGLKRDNNDVPDLLFAKSDDDNLTEWYVINGTCVTHIGYEFTDAGVINLSDTEL